MLRFWRRTSQAAPTAAMQVAAPGQLLQPRFLQRLARLELVARSMQAGSSRGQRVGRRVGVGIEFAEHRPYNAGDDLRFVDFAAYARSDRLLVKRFAEPQDLEVHILLDGSASMGLGDGQTLEYAKQLAAAVGYVSLANLDRLTVQLFAGDLGPRLPPMRGKTRALSLLRFLHAQNAQGTTRFARCAAQFVAREPRRGTTVVISDGYDREGLLPGIDALRFGRFEPKLLLVRDTRERAAISPGDFLLVDAETGEARDATISARSMQEHDERVAQHFAQLRADLRDRQVPSFELSCERPFDSALIDVLRRGGLFR